MSGLNTDYAVSFHPSGNNALTLNWLPSVLVQLTGASHIFTGLLTPVLRRPAQTHALPRPNLVLVPVKVRGFANPLPPRKREGCYSIGRAPRNNLQIFMFVKQLSVSPFIGSNLEVTLQIAKPEN